VSTCHLEQEGSLCLLQPHSVVSVHTISSFIFIPCQAGVYYLNPYLILQRKRKFLQPFKMWGFVYKPRSVLNHPRIILCLILGTTPWGRDYVIFILLCRWSNWGSEKEITFLDAHRSFDFTNDFKCWEKLQAQCSPLPADWPPPELERKLMAWCPSPWTL
jgi:hypothetical protein